MVDLLILFIASIFTFVLYGWDKFLAIYNKSRVPESILLIFTFLGGAFGALSAMILFHHKINKTHFAVCVPLFLCLQLAAIIVYRVSVL
jgi:uncharacterized membrane protein YsdA (DUF1294 family)